MKDGTTHLAYKPEHAVDLDTGAVVAAEVHAADEGDTTTLTGTLDAAQRNLTRVGAPPSSDNPAACVADKGYHSRAVLTDLDGGPWKTRIAEHQRQGVSRWHGDQDARRAVYNNRARLRSEVGKQAAARRSGSWACCLTKECSRADCSLPHANVPHAHAGARAGACTGSGVGDPALPNTSARAISLRQTFRRRWTVRSSRSG